MKYKDSGLIQPILRAVTEMGYTDLSPIQEEAIPPVLQGKDLIGCAQTGTGKTAAFGLPILQQLAGDDRAKRGPRRPIRSLVLTPTRELAIQIYDNMRQYGKYLPLTTEVIFGGVSQNPQTERLARGVDILVATPGRLNDLIGQGYIRLSEVEVFVLDEADRMLDMGFIHDVKKVIAQLPKARQTLLFSATMPAEIEKLSRTILIDPVRVAVTPVSSTVETIQQSVYFVDKANKRRLLLHLVKNNEMDSVLVFTRTKHGADRVVRELGKAGVKALAIHGNKSQNARQNALESFKNRTVRVLVATDIAARGLDISELSHVINYDLPNIPESYVHRIGRTGRAGRGGIALSFCDIEEKPYLADIEKLIRQSIPVVEEHPYPMQVFEVPEKVPQQKNGRTQQPKAPSLQRRDQAPGARQTQTGRGGSAAHQQRRRKPAGAHTGRRGEQK